MTILLADDHGLFRESVKQWLEMLDTNYQIKTAANRAEVNAALANGIQPKLMLLDLCMPGMNGVESIREIHMAWPHIPILVVSANDDPLVIRGCIEAGASGFVSKSGQGEEMLDAIRQTLAGKTYIPANAMSKTIPRFSDKQLKILRLLANGRSNREIAERAYLTEGTVKQYVSDILCKLGVDNRVQAGIRAREILGLNS